MAKSISRLFVDILANTTGLERDLKKLGQKTGEQMRRVGVAAGRALGLGLAAGLAGATVAVRKQLQEIDRAAKAARKLNIDVDQYRGLENAAEKAGIAASKLETGLQRMARRVSQAANGTGEAQEALRKLRLDAEELNKLAPEQQFKRIATALQGITNQNDQIAITQKLFDSEGVDLVRLLREGGDEIERMQARYLVLAGRVGDFSGGIEQANDAMTDVRSAFEGLGNDLTRAVAPVLKGIADEIVKMRMNGGSFASTFVKGIDSVIVVASSLVTVFQAWQTVIQGVRVTWQNVYIEMLKGAKSLGENFQMVGRIWSDTFGDKKQKEIQALGHELRAYQSQVANAKKSLESFGAGRGIENMLGLDADSNMVFEKLVPGDAEYEKLRARAEAQLGQYSAKVAAVRQQILDLGGDPATAATIAQPGGMFPGIDSEIATAQASLAPLQADLDAMVNGFVPLQERMSMTAQGLQDMRANFASVGTTGARSMGDVTAAIQNQQQAMASASAELDSFFAPLDKQADQVQEHFSSIQDASGQAFDSLARDLARGELSFSSLIDVALNFLSTLGQGNSLGGLSSLFGGNGSGFNLGSIFSGFFADGGTIRPGTFGVVGEQGPELAFAGNSPLDIVPMSQISNRGGGSSVQVIQNLHFTTDVKSGVRQEIQGLLPQLVEASRAAVNEADRRRKY